MRVHTTITDQQNGLVWVSEKVGSAIDDEDSEYDEGNDDRLVKHVVFGDKVTSQIKIPLFITFIRNFSTKSMKQVN